jgi:uncharacterized membrane protein
VSTPPPTRVTAPRHLTSAILTAGVTLAAVCFAIAIVAELAGVELGSGEMTDVGAIVAGLPRLTPWAWAALGAYAIVVTPVLGLLTTAWEYASVDDRRTVWLAITVLVILTASAVIAILR